MLQTSLVKLWTTVRRNPEQKQRTLHKNYHDTESNKLSSIEKIKKLSEREKKNDFKTNLECVGNWEINRNKETKKSKR